MDAERGGGGGGGEGARFPSSSSSQPTNNPNPNPNSYITSTTTPSSSLFNGLGVGSNQPPSISSSPPGIIQSGGGGGGGGGLMYLQHFNNGSSGSGMVSPSSISFNTVPRDNGEQQVKRKRGRPRRYTLDASGSGGGGGASGSGGGGGGNHQHQQNNNSNNNHVGLGLSPFSSASPPPSYSNNAPSSSDPASKRNRGRPPGTGKKQQQLDSLGSTGVAFTPHVIAVKAGEDVASKIMSFSQQGPHAVCILSANGAISNVTLRQPAMYGGTVTYEGRFEIISLSGSFLLTESGSTRSRSGGMSVSLAGADGRVLGGGVAGILMAATPVQVVVGKFIVEDEKPKAESFQREPSSALPPHMACFGTSVATASSPSQGASSESSDEEEEEEGSPLNRVPAAFNSTNQSIQNMSGYSPVNWGPSHLPYPPRHDPNMNNLHN